MTSVLSQSDPIAPIFVANWYQSIAVCWPSWRCHTFHIRSACPPLELTERKGERRDRVVSASCMHPPASFCSRKPKP